MNIYVNRISHIDKLEPFIAKISEFYPNADKWLSKVKTELIVDNGSRILVTIVKDNVIAGMMILKNSEEKKICSIMVDSRCRNKGLGRTMLRMSFIILETKSPMITVNQNVYYNSSLRYLLEDMGFVLTDIVKDMYKVGEDEYIFNGGL